MKSVIPLLKKHISLTKKTQLVVSVSGGIDSMALAHLLLKSSAHIIIVHFNHMQRQASYEEAKMVEAFANEHGLDYHYYTLELTSENFQHQAHTLRRHYLKEVARIHQTPYILTAHHLDDLFESILMKFTKGSNLLGYAGMQYIHEKEGYVFIKPLLYVEKQQIIDYVKQENVPYMNDASNDHDVYLRNRYRHTITPIMKQENPNILEAAKAYHYQLTQAFEYIRKQTLKYLKNKKTIDVPSFLNLDEAIKDDVLVYLIESYGIKANQRSLMKIKSVLASTKPNQTYQLSHDLHIIKSYDQAYISEIDMKDDVSIQINEGLTRFKNMSIFTFLTETNEVTEDFVKLCYNKLAFPLVLRHKKEGDMLHYDYGHKKLKKLFIDKKIPLAERNKRWVLTDSKDQVLYVEGLYVNRMLGEGHTLYFNITEDPHA